MNGSISNALTPVRRQALSDAVFEQLRARIVGGELGPGTPLPAERILCQALGVNRSSVREALRRLEQARLVSVRHGGTSHVLDYRDSAGLDLLPALLVTSEGQVDAQVVRGVLEMRSAIAADAARLAAEHADSAVADHLDEVCRAMASADDLAVLQDLAAEFWSVIIDASANIAYRLAYNSLRETYDQCRKILAQALAGELRDSGRYAAIAAAVRNGNSSEAQQSAGDLVRSGEASIKRALEEIESAARGVDA